MDDYKKFLAEQVLTEDKAVNYRTLSRAVKVHVNTAKQMLFDFQKSQNARKPNSIQATYLVSGTKIAEPVLSRQDDGDVEMSSSLPEADSIAEQVPVLAVCLVQEDSLEEVLSRFEHVSSAHIYSIGPSGLKDLQQFADPAHRALAVAASDGENSAESRLVFGGIANRHVRRRRGREVAPKATGAAAVVKKLDPPQKAAAAAVKEEEKEVKLPAKETPASSATGKKPTPSLSRGGSGGIMQAFAKGAAKPKKQQGSQPATPSGAEDNSNLALSDDGEDDSELMPKPTSGSARRKSRKEREEELRQMMEEDDDGDDDGEAEDKADTPMEDVEEPPEDVPEPQPDPVKAEAAEVISASSGDGRRRGKRRVMRKKQVMDEQGYLVTMQEADWESFSEDEPAPKKTATPTSTPSSQAAKAKKGGPKGTQGNIMSFFSKK